MSVVVVIKDGDNVIVGCDSQVGKGYSKNMLTNRNNYKIFKPIRDKNVIIGICGDLRDRDILFCIDEYIDELTKLKDEVNYKYIVKKIVPKIFNILEDYERIIHVKEKLPRMEIEIIFIYKNQIYKISHYGCVIEIDDYCAIGSGADYAVGYLNECDKTDMKEAVVKSIKSSIKTDLYVGYPIIIMNSENDDVEIIES